MITMAKKEVKQMNNTVMKTSCQCPSDFRKCKQCSAIKPKKQFDKRAENADGLNLICKACYKANKIDYYRTKKGLLGYIYHSQVGSSTKRGDPAPTYTLDEFRKWGMSSIEFHNLYDNWSGSGYLKMLIPSADRTDDYQGYSLDRLQWMTWEENWEKGNADRINGINNKSNKAVAQLTLDGLLFNVFYSMKQAQRATGISAAHICTCCGGERKTAGGFKWGYYENQNTST